MGHRIERTVYNLVLDDTPMAGAHIRVEAMSADERLNVLFDLDGKPEDTVHEGKEKLLKRYQLFIDHVVEWDLEDRGGNPVPVTVDDLLKACELEHVGAIMTAWVSAKTSVPAPLERPSPATSLSEIPMTVLESTPALAS